MSEMEKAELDDFGAKLNDFKCTLSAAQRQLLDKILSLAWSATEHEDALANGFSGSFSPAQAGLLLGYQIPTNSAESQITFALARLIKPSSFT
jgi:hypothetical protein